jgi:hypothetical protein
VKFTHDRLSDWGSLYKLHFWRWGITLDWGEHRFIFRSTRRSHFDDEADELSQGSGVAP